MVITKARCQMTDIKDEENLIVKARCQMMGTKYEETCNLDKSRRLRLDVR